jgi:hypothetical protein
LKEKQELLARIEHLSSTNEPPSKSLAGSAGLQSPQSGRPTKLEMQLRIELEKLRESVSRERKIAALKLSEYQDKVEELTR